MAVRLRAIALLYVTFIDEEKTQNFASGWWREENSIIGQFCCVRLEIAKSLSETFLFFVKSFQFSYVSFSN